MFGTARSSKRLPGLTFIVLRCSQLVSDSSFPMAIPATARDELVSASASPSAAASWLKIYPSSPSQLSNKAKVKSQA
jgi:hypothetical protein